MAGPLDGIRIIDLTTIYSGPFCTQILGDQGADVIKIESAEGDWMRIPLGQQRNGVNGAFAMMNRNKRSVVIDLSLEEGKDVLKRLVAEGDVVVEMAREVFKTLYCNHRMCGKPRCDVGSQRKRKQPLNQKHIKCIFGNGNQVNTSGATCK